MISLTDLLFPLLAFLGGVIVGVVIQEIRSK